MNRTDPYAMSSVRASGPSDPPQLNTNIVGVKVIRKILTPEATTGNIMVLAKDLLNCLPVVNPNARILKMSCWGADHQQISCVFPAGGADNGVGDDAAWSDRGVPGQSLAQIHVTPSFNFRNTWFSYKGQTRVGVFSSQRSSTEAYLPLTVDFTIEYRTALQSCPAYLYLQEFRNKEQTNTDSEKDSQPHTLE